MLDFLFFTWQEILYRPIYNLFIFVYHLTPGPNVGWAIIGLAILIRMVFLNSTLRGYQTETIMSNLEPYIEKINEEEKNNPKERKKRITELLKGKNINLYHEFYVIAAQLVFLIILYQVFQNGFNQKGMTLLYSFVPHPQVVKTIFGGIDLAKSNIWLSLVTAATLFVELVWEYNSKKNALRVRFSEKWFPLLLVVFTYILLTILPSAKALFIFVSVLISIIMRTIVNYSRSKSSDKSVLPEPVAS